MLDKGGELVYSARESRDESGRPTGTLDAIVGVDLANRDQALQRLENILRDGLAPRVPGIRSYRSERSSAVLRWLCAF
jgi:hypothetical protein